jgi:hypothetical protein
MPANKLATAQAVFELAIRFYGEVSSGRIDESIYRRQVQVITGDNGLLLPSDPSATIQDLNHGIFNLVLIALSATALSTDETLNEVFGKLISERDQNRLSIRVMVNQLRNAFAHNPWRPKWVVYPKYRNAYPITLYDGTKFTFDATLLDGAGVKPEQVGGLEFWIKLLQHCEQLVA